MKSFIKSFYSIIVNFIGLFYVIIPIGIVQFQNNPLVSKICLYTSWVIYGSLMIFSILYVIGSFKCSLEKSNLISYEYDNKLLYEYIAPFLIVSVAVYISIFAHLYLLACFTVLPMTINWFAREVNIYKARIYEQTH